MAVCEISWAVKKSFIAMSLYKIFYGFANSLTRGIESIRMGKSRNPWILGLYP
jgi:hypothetical protein